MTEMSRYVTSHSFLLASYLMYRYLETKPALKAVG
jgi:hypothetical protein